MTEPDDTMTSLPPLRCSSGSALYVATTAPTTFASRTRLTSARMADAFAYSCIRESWNAAWLRMTASTLHASRARVNAADDAGDTHSSIGHTCRTR
jgi:hypothetical protein